MKGETLMNKGNKGNQKVTITLEKRGNLKYYKVNIHVDGFQNPCFDVQSYVRETEKSIYNDGDGDFYYSNNNGIVTYGYVRESDPMHYGRKYRWSSRASIINAIISGLNLDTRETPYVVDVEDREIYAVTVDFLQKAIDQSTYKGKVAIVKTVNNQGEIFFRVVDKQ